MAGFDPNQMPRTSRHAIRYPGGTDLVKYASQQFKAMAESIDDTVDELPAKITDELTTATTNAKKYRDEASQFASNAGNITDQGVATVIRKLGGATRAALYGGSCLFIGDSYTEGFRSTSTAARWSTILSIAMGWTEQNVAAGGSGFTTGGSGGRTFLQQAQYAKSQNMTPDVVIVAGGRNDGASSVRSNALELFSYLSAQWPAARLITVPIMWDCKGVERNALARADDIRSAALDSGVEVIWHAWTWLYGHPEWTFKLADGSLDMHPNDAGYAVIAKYVRQGILGGPTSVTLARQQLPSVNTSVPGTGAVQIVDGIVHIQGQIGSVSNIYNGWNFTRLPPEARPVSNKYVLGYTADGATPILIRLNADNGECVVNNIYGSAGKGVGFPDICYPVGQ